MIEVDIAAFCPTPLKASGRYQSGPCPIAGCGGTDRFTIKDRFKWYCRVCSDTYRDGIDFLRLLHGIGYLQACALAKVAPEAPGARAERMDPKPTAAVEPSRQVQAGWNRYIKQCVQSLWSPSGRKALSWLHARGLNDDTLGRHCIGFDARGERHAVVIPWLLEGRPWAVRRRFSTGKPKYNGLVGSTPALYIGRPHNGGPVLLQEGEMDSMLVGQESAGLCGVATLGSASASVSAQAEMYLRGASRILVQTDADEAGDRAFRKLQQVWPQAERVPVLFGLKDPTEVWKAGGILANHLQAVLHPDSAATDALRLFPGSRVESFVCNH